jgi:hypothetical protein
MTEEQKRVMDESLQPLINDLVKKLGEIFDILPDDFKGISLKNKNGNDGYYIEKVGIINHADNSAELSDFGSEDIEFGDEECDL